ncbi:MAG: S9 family peptidase [Acidobacteria bacterium]|nr:S9 family peptidase [Acidobacteriota bacterium]
MRAFTFALLAVVVASDSSAQSIDELIALKRTSGTAAISADGRSVAYTVRETNWTDNAYETEIWLAEAGVSGSGRQLTMANKSSQSPAFSPDGKWLAFISDRSDTRQLYRLSLDGGEAEALTSGTEGVTAFEWAPDGASIAYTMTDPVTPAMKERAEKYGEYTHEDHDARMAQLHLLDVATKATRPLTAGAFVVGAFDWSPDGGRIAFDHRVSSDAGMSGSADISVVEVAGGAVTALVTQAGPDSNPKWSPDGRRIAFQSAMAKPFYFFANGTVAVVNASGGTPEPLTARFDENPSLVAWTKAGIFFGASQRTWSYLYRLDPDSRQTAMHRVREDWIGQSFAVTPAGAHAAFVASGPREFPDVYTAPIAPTLAPTKLSDLGAQVASWPKHSREVVRWKSQDGAEIEGVLHKPADFQAGRRYPLLVVIHGGPTGVSRPQPFGSASFYPIDGWLAKGALVLEPNYRGSAGYGEAFRSLNVRNLGIGDAWDVLSGIDHLVAQGLVDKDRVGSMGWSQGGYISAFLTTKHADRFKALSVGAGISNWVTYYVNTDIHPFTRQYLKATPWDDPKIYADTSPMTYIKSAQAPTLIQHGDKDPRVPIPNAFELYQGLQDQKVPVELMIFRGFGHGLDKPKANRAAMQQNWDWFGKYLWPGEAGSQERGR